ncbi:MAG TPA: hypothetical protein VFN53_04270 [Acidobacteriaceae bacterium]|nr:hypothetical protein [Acidobacteriaceae bacterium]
MKRLAFVLALGSITAFAGAQTGKTHKLTGYISDSKCGASNHASACVTKCINAGAKPVFVDANKKVWAIDNTDAVQNYYGDHVKLVATEDASNQTIHVNKVAKAKGMMMDKM